MAILKHPRWLVLAVVCAVLVFEFWRMALNTPPNLKDGDLIFQTSKSRQSTAILVATLSDYTHMGIIRQTPDGFVVIEAEAKVRETPIQDWINRGRLRRYAVYRRPDLTPAQTAEILSAAKALYGRPYNRLFSFDDPGIYCSELPYLAYKSAGLQLGQIQKVADLNFDNFLVKALIRQRWQKDAECVSHHDNFDQCYARIQSQPLVTPISIARDGSLREIFSNYPL